MVNIEHFLRNTDSGKIEIDHYLGKIGLYVIYIYQLLLANEEFKNRYESSDAIAQARKLQHEICSKFYISGGVYRDLLVGNDVYDLDLYMIGDDPANKLRSLYDNLVHYPQYNTYCFWNKDGLGIDVSAIQTNNKDGDLESLIAYLSNNDISISNIIITPLGEVIDPFGGLYDLVNRQLRIFGDVTLKLEKQPERILRIVRFAAQLDFTIEGNTAKIIKAFDKSKIHGVSLADIDYNMGKILMLPGELRNRAMQLFVDLGVAEYLPTKYTPLFKDQLAVSVEEFGKMFRPEKAAELASKFDTLAKAAPFEEVSSIFSTRFPDVSIELVGGAIVSSLTNQPVKDYDFVVNLSIQQIVQAMTQSGMKMTMNLTLCPNEFYVNWEGGSINFNSRDGKEVDISAAKGSSNIEDRKKRDITINTIGINNLGKLTTFGGLIDFENEVITFCNASEAGKDLFKMINALKSVAKTGFSINPQDLVIMRNTLPNLLSQYHDKDYLAYKLLQILDRSKPYYGKASLLLRELGLSDYIYRIMVDEVTKNDTETLQRLTELSQKVENQETFSKFKDEFFKLLGKILERYPFQWISDGIPFHADIVFQTESTICSSVVELAKSLLSRIGMEGLTGIANNGFHHICLALFRSDGSNNAFVLDINTGGTVNSGLSKKRNYNPIPETSHLFTYTGQNTFVIDLQHSQVNTQTLIGHTRVAIVSPSESLEFLSSWQNYLSYKNASNEKEKKVFLEKAMLGCLEVFEESDSVSLGGNAALNFYKIYLDENGFVQNNFSRQVQTVLLEAFTAVDNFLRSLLDHDKEFISSLAEMNKEDVNKISTTEPFDGEELRNYAISFQSSTTNITKDAVLLLAKKYFFNHISKSLLDKTEKIV
jgi:tRNA nucleotidyltransferase/poly(A) polymerase